MKKAFTLIELMIVLIIISVIIAAIIAGGRFIASSKMNKVAADLGKYSSLFSQFENTYGYMPGDFPKAEEVFGASNTNDGNGDGTIGVTQQVGGSSFGNNELVYLWNHLHLSGLLDEAYTGAHTAQTFTPATNIPAGPHEDSGYLITEVISSTASKISNTGIIYSVINADAASLDSNDDFTSAPAFPGVISSADTKKIDEKIDDGAPLTGNIRGFDGDPEYLGGDCVGSSAYTGFADGKVCFIVYLIKIARY
jgi:prepilin-type N-terminal cleavage/methylation domain-containing protein